MSQLHLATGSTQPPKVEGKLRLYSMEYCPYAQRARLVLRAKNVPHDVVNIDLEKKPEWYFKIHPEGKVPALVTDSEIIVESLVISDFLDEKYPNPPLYSMDAETKKRHKELIQKIDALTTIYYGILYGKEAKSAEIWAKELEPLVEEFTSELSSRGTTFYGGNKPGMLDYMLWPWGERAGVVKLRLAQKLPIPGAQSSIIKQWIAAMMEDPACSAIYNSTDKYWKLAQKRMQNLPADYDQV